VNVSLVGVFSLLCREVELHASKAGASLPFGSSAGRTQEWKRLDSTAALSCLAMRATFDEETSSSFRRRVRKSFGKIGTEAALAPRREGRCGGGVFSRELALRSAMPQG